MSLTTQYSDPQGTTEPAVLVSLGSNIRFGDLGLAMSAENGNPAASTVDLEDPGGLYSFVGLRAFDVRETSAPSNNRIIGRFAIQNRRITRSAQRGLLTGTDRLWEIDLVDYNWHLGRRLLLHNDAERDEESAGTRLHWLLEDVSNIEFHDYGHVVYPSETVDAYDFRGGGRPLDVLADCALEGGYMFWCDVNEATGRPELFFIDPNGEDYASTLFISNDVNEVDGVTVFPPSGDVMVERSPDRITSGALVAYRNGWRYWQNETTALQFARVDQVAPLDTVTSSARALRLAQKFTNENDEETDVITFTVILPAAQVNDIRHGHRLPVRLIHVPDYESGRWTRVLRRSVRQPEAGGGAYYEVDITAIPSGPIVPAPDFPVEDFTGNVFGGLQRTDGYGAGVDHIGFQALYSAALSGWDASPDLGPIVSAGEATTNPSVTVSQPMTVRIVARGEGANVFLPAQTRAINVTVNGVVVGSDSRLTNTGFDAWSREVDLRNFHLDAGDVVSVSGTITDEWGNLAVNHTYLIVGRGVSSYGVHLADGSIFEGP